MTIARRSLLLGALAVPACLAACAEGNDDSPTGGPTPNGDRDPSPTPAGWRMLAEDVEHERTWMCWPSRTDVWGADLPEVQQTIITIARAIADFEPVTMLAPAEEVAAVEALVDGAEVEVLEGPVDDLWARDTLPCFLVGEVDGQATLAAGRVRFNGWGAKQVHDGDAQLAGLVADHLGIELIDSGITGEGGGLEVDGNGTVLAAESSWVNDNRNPGMGRDEIEDALRELLGADRMIWVDGLAGYDITDGHIDTLARFIGEDAIVVDRPAVEDPDDPWSSVAMRTRAQVAAASTPDGAPYEIIEVTQPVQTRGAGDEFLATYMNFYVCNGAVFAPEFGDADADRAARAVLGEAFPDREIVQLNIDALAAGGGGIHCATQQQPRL
jgi:agmatine deiminase